MFYRFLIDFGAQLGAMLATFSAKMKRACGKLSLFLLRCFFEPIFFEMLTHFGSILLHFGAKLAPFWLHFAAILVPSWRYLGPLGRTSLHWMGWWGYAKRQEFSILWCAGAPGGPKKMEPKWLKMAPG